MIEEFTRLKSINCKNVIQVQNLLQEKSSGKVYLVMEYFQGKEMFEYISNMGSYSEQKAKYLFK